MKKFILLTILAVSMSVGVVAQKAQTKKEMTVKEYFLALPNEFLNAPAAKRSAWIENENAADGNLTFNIPISEITEEEGEGSVFGGLQVFKKKDGGILLGMVNNMCAEGECMGMMRFLDYKNGDFTDVSEDYLIIPDNDEVIKILRAAPAFEDKKSLKDGVQVPLAIDFYGGEKIINFVAGCKTSIDGGVVAKMFKWNGTAFTEFEYAESPE